MVTRDVLQDASGQYVPDGDGVKVYGVWALTEEAWDNAPGIVQASESKGKRP